MKMTEAGNALVKIARVVEKNQPVSVCVCVCARVCVCALVLYRLIGSQSETADYWRIL